MSTAYDFSGMTVAQLRTEFVALGNQVSTIDARRRAIDAELKRRAARAKAVATVGRLTPDEREALKGVL